MGKLLHLPFCYKCVYKGFYQVFVVGIKQLYLFELFKQFFIGELCGYGLILIALHQLVGGYIGGGQPLQHIGRGGGLLVSYLPNSM